MTIANQHSFGSHLRAYWPLAAILIFFGWLFFSLLSSHMLYPEADGWYSGGSAWGDLAWHTTLISSFAERGLKATLDANPVFQGARLSYSFAGDYLSALLVRAGWSLRNSLLVPSFVFLMIFVALIYLFTLAVTGKKVAAFIAPFIFFFNGSIFGVAAFLRDFRSSGLDFRQFLEAMPRQYAYISELNVRFSNITADYLMAQRTFIFGFVIGLIAFWFLWRYWISRDRLNLLWSGLIAAFLPLIHAHTFISLLLIAGFLFIYQLGRTPRDWLKIFSDWGCFALPVAVFGLPQVLYIFPLGRKGFTPHWQFGWLKGNESFLWFWIKNLSPHIFIFFWAWFRAPRREFKSFYLAFWFVFVVANVLVFEPYDYNNMKYMLWWFLVSSVAAADLLALLLAKRSVLTAVSALMLIISLMTVGILSVWREYNLSWSLFPNEDVALADFIKADTPKDALFLTSDEHKNPVPALAGRRIVMGYRGWLWTYGIDYRERELDVLKMYGGGEEAITLFKKYRLNYVVTEESKIGELNINKEFFLRNFPLKYQSQEYSAFKVE